MDQFHGVGTTTVSSPTTTHPFNTRAGNLHPTHERHEITGTTAEMWNVLENGGFESFLVTDAFPLDLIDPDRFQHGYDELNEDAVLVYWENMQRGESFPPIVIAYTGTHYYNASGRHRVAAADLAGMKTFPAYVIAVENEDVLQDLIEQFNLRHSRKPQSIDDGIRINRIREYINQNLSVRKISELVNMSYKATEKNVREQKALNVVLPYMPQAFRHRVETQRDHSNTRISGELWIPMAGIINAIDLPVDKEKEVNWMCQKLEKDRNSLTREALRHVEKDMQAANSYSERAEILSTFHKSIDQNVQQRKVSKKGVRGISTYPSARLVGEGLTKACQEPQAVLQSLSSLDEAIALRTHVSNSKRHIANLEHVLDKWIEEKVQAYE